MKADRHFFDYKGVRLHYLVFGKGPETLLCFHGYGQQAEHFRPLAKRFDKQFTIFSFDLFYHGKSEWPDCEVALSSDFMAEILRALMHACALEKVSLCGYSMGGKVVLSLAEKITPHIDKLLLIAPDGISTNFWYNMATYPYWMRRLFKYSIQNPAVFFKISQLFGVLKIVDKGVLRFANRQMNTQAKREKVYCSWLTYRKIKPEIDHLSKKLNLMQISVHIFLGRYDRIIRKKSVAPLYTKLNHCTVTILQRGHNTLIDDVAGYSQPIF